MWNHGDLLDLVARTIEPDAPALLHGNATRSWQEYDKRSNALARAFLASGALPGDKVAHLMRNSPAYLEVTAACVKARMVHVNVNYRYTGEELFYIFDNSDAAIIVYDAAFSEEINNLRARLPGVKLFLQTGAELDTLADGISTPLDITRSADDMLFIYTGGTTGMPKGVMWRLGDIWTLLGGGTLDVGGAPLTDMAVHADNIRTGKGRERMLVCPPLMHGSGYLMANYTLMRGGSVVTLPSASFDAAEALQAIHDHKTTWAVIVGDAFARPLLRALDASPGKYNLSSMKAIISSGTMWSPDVKAGLLKHHPGMMLLDSLGSSEALGLGLSPTTVQNVNQPTKFSHDLNTRVIADDGRDITPGSEEIGMIARGGLLPRGYYKDPEKTARLFREIDGKMYSIPGDFATVNADGSFTLLGRGNQCINTAGEKVFPEEVEEALKTHACVEDALVFGVPDEKWGNAVTAVVELNSAAQEQGLRDHVRRLLAGYKVPKRIIILAKMPRAANGKADYKTARELSGLDPFRL
jgi:3-oxocholest-4-en-26-oate---CoA ligase